MKWAPDASHFTETTESLVVVRDRSGSIVANYPGNVAIWLDDSRFLFQDRETPRRTLIGDARGSDPVPVDAPFALGGAVSNMRGVVAGARPRGNDWPGQRYDYSVWAADGRTRWRDGYPLVWAPDGSKLALAHALESVRGPGGWLSVVETPGLSILYADEPPFAASDAAFDPTSSHVAYRTGGSPEHGPAVVRVANVATTEVIDIPRDPSSGYYWGPDGSLSVTRESGVLEVYDSTGAMVDSGRSLGLAVMTSADLSTRVFWDVERKSALHVVRHDGVTAYEPPNVDWSHLALAPDGSAVIVSVGWSGGFLLDL